MLRQLNLLFCFLFLSGPLAFAKNRNEVIHDASIYRDLTWKPSNNNILDNFNHSNNLTVSKEDLPEGSDGIDDRAFKWNPKTTPPRWEYSENNWPYKVCSTCTYSGEAYAWGGWTDGALWGADTISTFTTNLNDPLGWIAGGREGNGIPSSGKTIMPPGYKGYTGIDCSGFVGNALDIGRFAVDKYKFNTTLLQTQALSVEVGKLKPGDIINSPGDHVAMFVEWIDKPSVARILHSSYFHFAVGKYEYRVVEDSYNLSGGLRKSIRRFEKNVGL